MDPTKQINRYITALGSNFLGFEVVPGLLMFQDDIRDPLLVERIKYQTAGAGIIYYELYFKNNSGSILDNLSPVPVVIALTAAAALTAELSLVLAAYSPASAVAF